MYEVSLQLVGAPELIINTFDKLGDTRSCWGWHNNLASEKLFECVNVAGAEYPKDEIKDKSEKPASSR